jgi:hypothetical protein
MQQIRADDVAPVPWRNGGGITRELLAWPSSQDWRCRLSVADIASDGPFSAFPGVIRHFVVLEGDGVALDFGSGRVEQRPGDAPLAFDGAAAPGCRLLGGPVRDLNLMIRGGRGALRPIADAWQPPHHDIAGLFTRVAGTWRAGTETRALPAQTLLTATPADLPADAVPWTFEPDTPTTLPGWWFCHEDTTE